MIKFYLESILNVNYRLPELNFGYEDWEDLFRYEVFEMLKAEGKITDSVIENMRIHHLIRP